MNDGEESTYDDGKIACDEHGLLIRRYYPWGSKRVPYSSIKGIEKLQIGGASGRWRIWGSGDLVHWWNLDTKRPGKTVALVVDVGRRLLPTITPDDPEAVDRILTGHLGS